MQRLLQAFIRALFVLPAPQQLTQKKLKIARFFLFGSGSIQPHGLHVSGILAQICHQRIQIRQSASARIRA